MIKRLTDEKNTQIRKRLTAILVAVVFVFGTVVIPTEIYGTETDTPAGYDQRMGADNAAESETEQAVADEDSTTPAADVEEPQIEIEEPAAEPEESIDDVEVIATEEIVEELNEAVAVDLDSIDEDAYDGFMYKLSDDTTKKEIKEMENAIGDLDEKEGQEVEVVISKELYTADSIETIAKVADPSMIESIEPDYIVRAAGTNDTYYAADGWYLDQINAPYIWDKGVTGEGVKVAVLDTGVYENHPDFENTDFTAEYNAINKTEGDATDNDGHGTLVAGIIAASYNNGKGLTGIMPDATIIPVKVLSSERGKESYVVRGIEHAVNHGADVINMSLSGPVGSSYLKAACDAAAAEGVILVGAAGNEADDPYYGYLNPIEYPASFDSVISVGSVGKSGTHSSFSNYNRFVAVTSYGERIRGPYAYYKDSAYHVAYARYNGTSFSCPQVAAMAVMIKQLAKQSGFDVDYKGFERIIAGSSDDKGAKGKDPYYGYGIINLERAYRYMTEDDISPYDAILSASSFVYDGSVKTPSVTVKKANRALPTDTYATEYASGRKAVGTYKVTVIGMNGYIGARTVSFNIVPPLVKGIKKPLRAKKSLIVRWKAMSKSQKTKYKKVITGYQVRVATKPDFSNAKYVKVKGISKTRATVKKLKRKTKYYVQYRSYKTVGSVKYYSKWSSTKKVKTR